MKEVKGVLQCVTGFSLPIGNDLYALYPAGRHLRGAMGYIAMKLGLGMASRFPDIDWDGVIFRDLLPLSGCGKPYKILNDGRFDSCSECGDRYNGKLLKSVRTQKLKYKQVREGRKYRLSIVVQDETLMPEVEAMLRYVSQFGIYFGKMISQGHGKFELRDYAIVETAPVRAEKVMLLSDAVLPEGTKSLSFGVKVESKGEFNPVRVYVVPAGITLTGIFSGVYTGKYGGLGFGEIAPL